MKDASNFLKLCLLSQVDPRGKTWNRLRSSIGMPNFTADTQVEMQMDKYQLEAEAQSHHVVTH